MIELLIQAPWLLLIAHCVSASPVLSHQDPTSLPIKNGTFAWYEAQDARAPVASRWTSNALKSGALPTNAWWQNLVTAAGTTPDQNAVLTEPYTLQATGQYHI